MFVYPVLVIPQVHTEVYLIRFLTFLQLQEFLRAIFAQYTTLTAYFSRTVEERLGL